MFVFQRVFYWRAILTLICLFTIVVAILAATGQTFAAPRSTSGSYGSIAYSMAQSTPFFAFADSKVTAEANALNACYNAGATDCNVPVWVENGYLSIAIDFSWSNVADRPWGTGWGSTQANAEQYAKEGCVAHNGNAQTCLLSTQSTNPQDSADGGFGWGALSAKIGKAIAWAFSLTPAEQGKYYGNCEVFVENAYGTQYKFLTAQKAFDNLSHSTNWSPDIGALVFFKYFNPTDQRWDGHVGIYLGDGEFISALQSHTIVQIKSLQEWNSSYPYEGWADAPSDWPGR